MIATRSPTLIPRDTRTSTALPSRIANTTGPASRAAIASGCTASSGFCWSAVTSCDRNDTFALISGSMRGSIASNCTLVITVAFARSTVGTIRLMRPRKRLSGSASSVISQGCPTLTLARLDSETSASTSSVAMSAMVTTAPFESAADENGVTMSPTLALFDTITPSNGARISV